MVIMTPNAFKKIKSYFLRSSFSDKKKRADYDEKKNRYRTNANHRWLIKS